MINAMRELAVPIAVFYLACCGYLGWKNKDRLEVGIAAGCVLLGVVVVLVMR